MSLHAYAVLHCDAPGCSAALSLPSPLRFGRLNPHQAFELSAAAASAGWRARWVDEADDHVEHYCPEHGSDTHDRHRKSPGNQVAPRER